LQKDRKDALDKIMNPSLSGHESTHLELVKEAVEEMKESKESDKAKEDRDADDAILSLQSEQQKKLDEIRQALKK
jgi:hypothetical protein